jgi:hypothetical protein
MSIEMSPEASIETHSKPLFGIGGQKCRNAQKVVNFQFTTLTYRSSIAQF